MFIPLSLKFRVVCFLFYVCLPSENVVNFSVRWFGRGWLLVIFMVLVEDGYMLFSFNLVFLDFALGFSLYL